MLTTTAETPLHFTNLGLDYGQFRDFLVPSAEEPHDFEDARELYLFLNGLVWQNVLRGQQLGSAINIQQSLDAALTDYANITFPNGLDQTHPRKLSHFGNSGLSEEQLMRYTDFVSLASIPGNTVDEYELLLREVWTQVTDRATLNAAKHLTTSLQSALIDRVILLLSN